MTPTKNGALQKAHFVQQQKMPKIYLSRRTELSDFYKEIFKFVV